MSKNLSAYLRYNDLDEDVKTNSTASADNKKTNRTRLSIKYTF